MSAYGVLLGIPLWACIAVLVLPLLALTIALVVITSRRSTDVRANDQVATSAIRLVGGAFIFVSAFATAAMWQESNRAAETIGAEFGHARVVVNQLVAQQAPGTGALVDELRAYAQVVKADELMSMNAQAGTDDANVHIQRVVSGIISLDNQQRINSNDVKVLLDALAGMTTARNERLSQPYPVLPLPLFALVLTLGTLTVILAASYPSGPDRRLKWLQALTAWAVVAAVLSTIMLLLNGESGWFLDLRVGPAADFLAQTSAIAQG